jgi:hypothetical protein
MFGNTRWSTRPPSRGAGTRARTSRTRRRPGRRRTGRTRRASRRLKRASRSRRRPPRRRRRRRRRTSGRSARRYVGGGVLRRLRRVQAPSSVSRQVSLLDEGHASLIQAVATQVVVKPLAGDHWQQQRQPPGKAARPQQRRGRPHAEEREAEEICGRDGDEKPPSQRGRKDSARVCGGSDSVAAAAAAAAAAEAAVGLGPTPGAHVLGNVNCLDASEAGQPPAPPPSVVAAGLGSGAHSVRPAAAAEGGLPTRTLISLPARERKAWDPSASNPPAPSSTSKPLVAVKTPTALASSSVMQATTPQAAAAPTPSGAFNVLTWNVENLTVGKTKELILLDLVVYSIY